MLLGDSQLPCKQPNMKIIYYQSSKSTLPKLNVSERLYFIPVMFKIFIQQGSKRLKLCLAQGTFSLHSGSKWGLVTVRGFHCAMKTLNSLSSLP